MYQDRTYRDFEESQRLIPFQVKVKETDLYIKSRSCLKNEARKLVLKYRNQIEEYVRSHPSFEKSLDPLPFDELAPPIVKEMLKASSEAAVGPMAAVAGTIAEFVGKGLLAYSPEVIVENGGDIFMQVSDKININIFAGKSPISQKIGIKILPSETPLGVCTSSGTVGPSLSFGRSDSVTVLSSSTALADAAATSIANVIHRKTDIPRGLKLTKSIAQIKGVIIIVGKEIGCQGKIELITCQNDD